MEILDGSSQKTVEKHSTINNLMVELLIIAGLSICQILLLSYTFLSIINLIFISGSSLISLWENYCFAFIALVFIFSIECLLLLRFHKSRSLFFGVMCWLITAAALIPILSCSIQIVSYSKYYETFDSTRWNANQNKPLTMIRTIISDDRFIGKTRLDVINALGQPDNPFGAKFAYSTDEAENILLFEFNNNVVESYDLKSFWSF